MADKKYFYGNEVSIYGVKNGYIDYRCFAKSFEAVLNNNIMAELENKGFYFEPYNLFEDNSEKIAELEERIAELEELEELEKVAELQEELEELEAAQEEYPDIFQYYIVSDNAIRLLDEAGEIYFYNEELDIYIWGVTHFGTSWDYVLTNIKIDY